VVEQKFLCSIVSHRIDQPMSLRTVFHSISTTCFGLLGISIWVLRSASTLLATDISADELRFFETKIRPVLVRECYSCHSNETGAAKGGLRLDTARLSQLGGDSGPAIVPGDLDESWLWSAINHDGFNMPPKRKLTDDVIEDFRRWIEMGAPDPRETEVLAVETSITAEEIQQARHRFWAYQSPRASAAPATTQTTWAKTEIDHFILARLESAGIEPAQDAEPYQVLRRLCFDLVGLPPTPTEIDQFSRHWMSDPDTAIAAKVDQLLQSEHFGERWGRHWLDVARYAESTGRAINMTYPHAWRYRDFVIDSFNQDKPFDHFVKQQLAGDLMPVKDDHEWTENLIATTFLAIGPKNVNEQSGAQFAADLADEQLDTTTRVFMGTSVACARCHDHKFDPIPQSDYYAMVGIFRNMKTYFGNPPSQYGSFGGVQARRKSSLLLLPVQDADPVGQTLRPDEMMRLRTQLETSVAELSELTRQRRLGQSAPGAGSQMQANPQMQILRLNSITAALSDRLAVIDEHGQPRSYCMGVQTTDTSRDWELLVRGEIDQPGQVVPRDVPQVLRSHSLEIKDGSSGRLELAAWIASRENPLTARVMVNRIWQSLLGQGLVTTTEDFGMTGRPPSHPELLDTLAVQFMDSGWSVKSLVREIATSRVYRLSSAFDERHHRADPENAWLWRANPRRLDAEALRDAMLLISGEMDLQRPRGSVVAEAGYVRVQDGSLGRGSGRDQQREMFDRSRMQARLLGGRFTGVMRDSQTLPSLPPQKPLDMTDAKCRSVYLPIVRDEVPRALEVFDFAESTLVVGTRESSNTPNQALYLMNNPFVITCSDALARRLIDASQEPAEIIERACLLAYGRTATQGERAVLGEFIETFQPSRSGPLGELEKWSVMCQSLFAAAEFRYLD